MLTVILPAAGKGSRLSLPYPKEILKLDKTQALIDYSFDHFKKYNRNDVNFVVIINEHKTEIVEYIAKYKDKFNITFTYQNPNEHEYTGAIKSASYLFSHYNVVLLPDTILKLKNNADLYQTVIERLLLDDWSFFYKKENNAEMLKTKGALFVENNRVKMYMDKPTDNISNYNAYWTSFAFTKNSFTKSIEFMEKSTLNKQVSAEEIQNCPIYNTLGIEVEEYMDLGTWPEIRKLLGEHTE